jgi:hypothetical protein
VTVCRAARGAGFRGVARRPGFGFVGGAGVGAAGGVLLVGIPVGAAAHILSMGPPPDRRKRTSSAAAKSRKMMLRKVV